METRYHITVNISTPQGMLETGKLFLGTDQGFAEGLSRQLQGTEGTPEYPAIRLDLLGTTGSQLPVCISSIACTLDEYGENSRTITREVFRHFMFDAAVGDDTLGVP